jgi:hypothetical protein
VGVTGIDEGEDEDADEDAGEEDEWPISYI